jgi:hypothetical protein
VTSKPDRSTRFHSENEEANVNTFFTTVNLSAELLGEQLVPISSCESAGQPDEVPVVVGYADEDEDEEEDEEDVDDLDEDEDEEEDGEDIDYGWEEVADEDEEEDDEEEEEIDDEDE